VNGDPWTWRIDSGGFLGVANRRIASAMIDEDGIRQRWESIGCKLDERGRRLFAAAEVEAAGYGALAIVSKITGIARSTINRGEDDLGEGPLLGGCFSGVVFLAMGLILQRGRRIIQVYGASYRLSACAANVPCSVLPGASLGQRPLQPLFGL
jgi:hypothetical protein